MDFAPIGETQDSQNAVAGSNHALSSEVEGIGIDHPIPPQTAAAFNAAREPPADASERTLARNNEETDRKAPVRSGVERTRSTRSRVGQMQSTIISNGLGQFGTEEPTQSREGSLREEEVVSGSFKFLLAKSAFGCCLCRIFRKPLFKRGF